MDGRRVQAERERINRVMAKGSFMVVLKDNFGGDYRGVCGRVQ